MVTLTHHLGRTVDRSRCRSARALATLRPMSGAWRGSTVAPASFGTGLAAFAFNAHGNRTEQADGTTKTSIERSTRNLGARST